jgi:hypothetical protein
MTEKNFPEKSFEPLHKTEREKDEKARLKIFQKKNFPETSFEPLYTTEREKDRLMNQG